MQQKKKHHLPNYILMLVEWITAVPSWSLKLTKLCTALPHLTGKYNYSSFAKPSKLDELLRSQSITDVYLTGINTDYCIFATALDAFYLQYNVHIIEEGVSFVGGSSGHHQGLEQIAKFGCARVVSVKDMI